VVAGSNVDLPRDEGRPDYDPDMEDEVSSARWVVLHMIEETACHCGHLDIARELLDGQTNLGLR
jgi:Protein of unknown function (DUF664)